VPWVCTSFQNVRTKGTDNATDSSNRLVTIGKFASVAGTSIQQSTYLSASMRSVPPRLEPLAHCHGLHRPLPTQHHTTANYFSAQHEQHTHHAVTG
jgi:hypothetical protein